MAEVVYELNCDSCGNQFSVTFEQDLIEGAEPMYCPFCSYDIDLTEVNDDECFDNKYKDFYEENFAKED